MTNLALDSRRNQVLSQDINYQTWLRVLATAVQISPEHIHFEGIHMYYLEKNKKL